MFTVISGVLGGVGLFLLGMILMTDGLKALAGGALRSVLARFTSNRFKAVAAGAGITMVVQSSSATTMATIGFVSAGLLSFSNAVGVVIGAAVGTTGTGWLVAVLGLKLSIGKIMLPLIGVGALAKLMAKRRIAQIGLVLAGFGVIFVGIDVLQASMQGLSEFFRPEDFPRATLGGRFLLVLIGMAMTVVMQSSSAAVATTLAAVSGGTISLEQAAALVVGQNVGTAISSALASIGGTAPAKRTAIAHILFNLSSGTIGFLVLPFAVHLLDQWAVAVADGNHALAIAAFHTAFNLLGALVYIPILPRFAAFIEKRVKLRGPRLTQHLDASLLAVPTVAIEACRNVLKEIGATLFDLLREKLGGGKHRMGGVDLDEVDTALDEVRRFMAKVPPPESGGFEMHRQTSTLHAVDHLERLCADSREVAVVEVVRSMPELRQMSDELAGLLGEAAPNLRDPAIEPDETRAQALSTRLADERRSARPQILEATAARRIDPDKALDQLHAQRWLDRLAYHVWRATHHLREMTRKELAAEHGEMAGSPADVGAPALVHPPTSAPPQA